MKPCELLEKDPLLKVEVLAATPFPQRVCWAAMHQDYYELPVAYSPTFNSTTKDEKWFGDKVVENCLTVGHLGVIEHPQIIVNFINFPHCVMQQLRTHRVGLSFDCQSARYTGKRFSDDGFTIEELIYLRPVGEYTDRQGDKYHYSQGQREEDLKLAEIIRARYRTRMLEGISEEHTRGLLAFDFRQHFVMSGNLRAMLHLLHLREKADAQLECQAAMVRLHEKLAEWCPEVLNWWESKGSRGKLAP